MHLHKDPTKSTGSWARRHDNIYILPSSRKASFLAVRSGELCDIYHGIGARVGHLEVMHLPSFSTLHLLIGTSATQQTKYKIAAVAAHCRYCCQVAL